MRNKLLTLIPLLLLAMLSTGASPGDDQPDEAALVASSRTFDAAGVVALVYAGRSDSALAIVEAEEQANPTDPLVLIVKARAMRDQLADEDDDKSRIGDDAKPILEVLDRAIKLCDQALDHDASDPVYKYYKGRAYLSRAQMHTLSRSYWSAGQDSRKAKKHLEQYLEVAPGHPDASGDLGAFLYFADTLPGVVKFLGKLFLLPGGDRGRGLELLHHAAQGGGIFETDYIIALAAINLLFEGRLRDGANQMLALQRRYPNYTRLAEPVGVLAPLDPLRMVDLLNVHDAAVERHATSPNVRYDDSLVKRMRFHSAYAQLFFGSPTAALSRFDVLLAAAPERPDWFVPIILANAAFFKTMNGDRDGATADYKRVLSDDTMGHFHEISNKMLESMDADPTRRRLEDLEWVVDIYLARVKQARRGLDDYESKYGRDHAYLFYAGEIALFEQDFESARRSYERCMDQYVLGVDQSYQFYACLRLAEIHGHQFRYEMARDYYDKARQFNRVTYLLDFMMNSRVRYYGLLEDGVISGQPRLLYYPDIEKESWRTTSP